jgi:hypothetical protein
MRPAVATCVGLACLLLGGCSASTTPKPSPTPTVNLRSGVIEGNTVPCVGPHLPPTVRRYGAVTLKYASGGLIAQQRVYSPYTFRFEVKPGHYVLVGNTGKTVPVSVSAGQTAEANVDQPCI